MVTARIPLVTTTDPTDATTLDQQRIKELPINGRDLNTLLHGRHPRHRTGGDVNGGVRTGGLMVYSTTYSQDGASANNREFGGSTGLQGLESIGEVRIETSTGNAKSSSPLGDRLHARRHQRYIASLYETTRNNCCGVAKHRQDVNPNGTPFHAAQADPQRISADRSAVPLILPTFGLNGTQDLQRPQPDFLLRLAGKVASAPGPDLFVLRPHRRAAPGQLHRSRDQHRPADHHLRSRTPAQIQTQTKNPPSRSASPFPNNMIPVTRESPLAKYIYGITPLPTDITEPNIATNLKYAFGNSSLPSHEQ